MQLIYSRQDQRIYLKRDNSEVKSWECRSDFVDGYNDAGQPRESLPIGEYTVSADEPPAENNAAYGTFYITTGDPRGRDIHGGGSGCDDPLTDYQGWCPTYGCLRMQNADGQELSRIIIASGNSVPLKVQEDPFATEEPKTGRVVNPYFFEFAKVAAELANTGRDNIIKPEWIYAQWVHESTNIDKDSRFYGQPFMSGMALDYNNLAGLTQEAPNNTPQPDGQYFYMQFRNCKAYAEYFGRYLRYYAIDGIYEVTDIDGYVAALKHGGYFGDLLETYLARCKAILRETFGEEWT